MPSKELTAALKLAEERNLRFVSLQFTDIVGQVKSVQVPMHQLEEAVEHGKWFDGSSIEGFARIAESDMFLVPDLATFAPIPWEPGFEADGSRARDRRRPRHLRRLHAERRAVPRRPALGAAPAAGEGEEARLRPEHRAGAGVLPAAAQRRPMSRRCRTTRPATSTSPSDLGTEVRKEMMNDLEAFGIKVETAHHEVATGQHEIDFEYADALRTADNAVTFKTTLKAVAARKGLYATFMPKPFFGINGSGMHYPPEPVGHQEGEERLRRCEGRLRAVRRRRAATSPARWSTPAA